MQIALRHLGRVRSLCLYEPVTFGVLRELAPRDPALMEITNVAHTIRGLVQRASSTRPLRFSSATGVAMPARLTLPILLMRMPR